ncbi:MAG: hypothetical protein ACRDMZ_03160, partial [Solirubrobacteraceae bacterium]
MKDVLRKLAIPLLFLVIALPAGIGVVMAMGDRDTSDDESAFTPISRGGAPRFERHAQPRWERVATLTGKGSGARSFAIAPRAIQWRTNWSCTTGSFKLSVARATQKAKVLAASSCPDVGTETSTGRGDGRLTVEASAAWRVDVRQQVDTALEEPALPGMTAAALLARGRLHDVQKRGEGTVALYRLAGGRLALRFENFYTSPSPGLRLWLTRAGDVTSTLAARRAKVVDAGAI